MNGFIFEIIRSAFYIALVIVAIAMLYEIIKRFRHKDKRLEKVRGTIHIFSDEDGIYACLELDNESALSEIIGEDYVTLAVNVHDPNEAETPRKESS